MKANHKTTDAKIDANKDEMEGRIDANNEKSEVLQGTLVSWMDVHQARTMSTKEEIKAKVDIQQEKMEAAIHSIWSELGETIKHWVEDVLSCVDQKIQGLHKELTETIYETQVDLQAIRTSVDMQTESLLEAITNTREHLHKELGLMILGTNDENPNRYNVVRTRGQDSRNGSLSRA
jgi:uncharacterized membrane-anchored protein YjiN (DUF445 family)